MRFLQSTTTSVRAAIIKMQTCNRLATIKQRTKLNEGKADQLVARPTTTQEKRAWPGMMSMISILANRPMSPLCVRAWTVIQVLA
mmetsp:Transcript_80367/g.141836  ORF Transcript_80367/g.141836 Transcript_80367/m.141836 type:complete len:85 (+) Transcript_80367:326-580(+)